MSTLVDFSPHHWSTQSETVAIFQKFSVPPATIKNHEKQHIQPQGNKKWERGIVQNRYWVVRVGLRGFWLVREQGEQIGDRKEEIGNLQIPNLFYIQ